MLTEENSRQLRSIRKRRNNQTYHFLFVGYWKMVWFGWVLWYINHCRLSYSSSSLYIYIKFIWFGLFGFYDISTIVGYLMPNLVYTYISKVGVWSRGGPIATTPRCRGGRYSFPGIAPLYPWYIAYIAES